MAEIKNPNNYICLDFYFIKLEMCLTAEFICSARLGRRNSPLFSLVLLFKQKRRLLDGCSSLPPTKNNTFFLRGPPHAAGMCWMVEPLAVAAVAVGADGLMVEVHNDPPHAKCDGAQSLTPEKFRHLMDRLNPLIGLMGKKLV